MPALRKFAELRVPSDPLKVSEQCLSKPIGVHLEAAIVIKKNVVQSPQRLGHYAAFHPPVENRRETLVERGRVGDLLRANLRSNRVGGEHECHCIGFADQCLDTLPPIFEDKYLSAIDQRLEATRNKGSFKAIGKSRVLARIGNEDSGSRLRTQHSSESPPKGTAVDGRSRSSTGRA
jgi:hypothetical protein